MNKKLLASCGAILILAGCSKDETTVVATPAPVAPPAAMVTVSPAPAAPSAAPPAAPATPVVVAPEDKLEPASIDNARLPGGAVLATDTPLANPKK
ncbi:MAG: hypothetical protein H7327_10860 [Herminiimonas sp.]|nr:hypothetical protein [Herminiimonas sp.]